jgi:hypothetical protein
MIVAEGTSIQHTAFDRVDYFVFVLVAVLTWA